MKTAMNMLNQIKVLLGAEEEEVKLAQMTLENGTIFEAEEFAPEYEVFIVTAEDRIAVPVGDYALEDGRILVVEEEGIIKEIKEVAGEEPVEEEAPAEIPAEMSEEPSFVSKEEFSNAIEELKAMIVGLTKVEELSEELPTELKEELSKPSAEPIKHSPEAEIEKKVQGFKFSNKRGESVQDRVNRIMTQFKK